MSNQMLRSIRLFQWLLLLCLAINRINSELKVSARCGRPGLPAQASLWRISEHRDRFENNEKVLIDCKNDDYPNHKQERECRNGRWNGTIGRCGRYNDAQVTHLDILDCKTPDNRQLVSQPINQTAEGPADYPPLRPNSFHTLRVPLDSSISANESTCYTWRIRFDRKVQIPFLLIDIWIPNNNSTQSAEKPTLDTIVSKYRTCALQETHVQTMTSDTVIGYYYFCDLNSEADAKQELSDLNDSITVQINTRVEKEIGLEAVFIGDLYKKTKAKKEVIDCGQFEVKNIGVDFQEESGHTYISCNDSFVDNKRDNIKSMNSVGNPKHIFLCNSNGQWIGQWPECVPKVNCTKDEILNNIDKTVAIEEIGNVYYLNESQWFAINDTFVRYVCSHENDIMIGKGIRVCMKNGNWSTKEPHCTSASLSGLAISGILFAVLIIFVLIVLFVFRTHSKRVKRQLRETRNEIEETHRKRISDEFYADVVDETCFEKGGQCDPAMQYDTVGYEMVADAPRYHSGLNTNMELHPEYLSMLALK